MVCVGCTFPPLILFLTINHLPNLLKLVLVTVAAVSATSTSAAIMTLLLWLLPCFALCS